LLFSIIKAIWSYLFPILYFLLYYIYYVFQNWHIRASFPSNNLVRRNVFRFCFENHWIQSNCKFTKSYLSFENLGRWLGFSTTSVFYHCFFCTWAWKHYTSSLVEYIFKKNLGYIPVRIGKGCWSCFFSNRTHWWSFK